LDSIKEAKAESERELKKKAEDSAKEIANLSTEIEGLKVKVKQFGDYDEIKRELEIMKVCLGVVNRDVIDTRKVLNRSSLSSPALTSMSTMMSTSPILTLKLQTNRNPAHWKTFLLPKTNDCSMK